MTGLAVQNNPENQVGINARGGCASVTERAGKRPHIIVLGNEKGGSGKSTTSLHLIVSLLKQGYSVGALDIDARQGSLSRSLENRAAFAESRGIDLELPSHQRVYRSEAETKTAAEAEEIERLESALAAFWDKDFLVIDTPGSDTHLSRQAHTYADILVTPLNDSFLDLDLLARVDLEAEKILKPSVYSQMVWEQRQQRARSGGRPIDWVVMRNRLSHIDARNKREIGRLLNMLAPRIGFRLAPGFGERVIFRELFPKGLTLLDLRTPGIDIRMSMSHLAARQEVRSLLEAIGLPEPESGPEEAGTKADAPEAAPEAALKATPQADSEGQEGDAGTGSEGLAALP